LVEKVDDREMICFRGDHQRSLTRVVDGIKKGTSVQQPLHFGDISFFAGAHENGSSLSISRLKDLTFS